MVETISVNNNDSDIVILGNHLENCTDAFEKPMKSSLLNIYKCDVNIVTKSELTYKISDIKCKLVSVAYNEHLFFVSLIHTLL